MPRRANETAHQAHRVLFLADSFLPHAGGSRVYYYNLYRHLTTDYDDKVTVLTRKVPGWEEFDPTAESPNLRIIRRGRPLPDWRAHRLPTLLPTFIESLVRIRGIDIVHCGDLFPQGVTAMGLKRLWGVPYIAYCHGEEITQIDYRRFQPKVRDAIYKRADAVIAANDFARRNLMRIGVHADQIFKITPGVDLEQFYPAAAPAELVRQFKRNGELVLLSVGRLVPRKGHAEILHAISTLKDNSPRFHYVIAGDGPERENLIRLVRDLGLQNCVTLTGKIADQALTDLYRLCDVFLLANREINGDLEGFGMVFIEANAVGKPVIGGRTGGTAEAIVENSTGLLVDPENRNDLASAIQLLLTRPDLRAKFGEAGLQRAQTSFSWKESARLLRDATEVVLNRSAANNHRSQRG